MARLGSGGRCTFAVVRLLVLWLGCSAIAACGQFGPLRLPNPEVNPEATGKAPAATNKAPAADNKKKATP